MNNLRGVPERDAYDRMSANEFVGLANRKPFSHLRGKQRKELKRLIRTQKTGHESKRSWWERYHNYIHSPKWFALKERIMRKRGVSCERCGVSGSVRPVHLHHISYKNLGHERDEDLKLYCEDCHQKMHPKRQINFQRRTH